MLTDDHAFVGGLAVAHEQAPALLQVEQRVSQRFTGAIADHHALGPLAHILVAGRIEAIEQVIQQARAAGHRQKLGLEADQATRWHAELQPHTSGAVRVHVEHGCAALLQCLDDRALVLGLDIHRDLLPRLLLLAINLAGDDLGT